MRIFATVFSVLLGRLEKAKPVVRYTKKEERKRGEKRGKIQRDFTMQRLRRHTVKQ